MAGSEPDSSLEERKLALDERKLESETEFRRRELEMKVREGGWFARLASPLTTTIIAGVLTLAASVAGTLFQGRQTLQLEREKFKFSKEQETQKQEHELILKMISVGDVQQARNNLEFLAETGLISDRARADRLINAKSVPVLPVPGGTPQDRMLNRCEVSQAVRFKIDFPQEGDVSLQIESCAYKIDGTSQAYRYVYRLENKSDNSLSDVRWRGRQPILAAAQMRPGQYYYSTRLLSSPPLVAESELLIGPSLTRKIEIVVPSEGQ